MALVALTPQQQGQRISWLWRTAGWRTAAALARTMEEKDEGILTKLGKGDSITPPRLFSIAVNCTGRGNVIDNIDVVLGFLHGTKTEEDVWIARPSDSGVSNLYSESDLTDLGFRDLVAV